MSIQTANLMACTIARLLKDREVVFFGLASPLVMVATLLARATHAPNLTFLSIPGSVDSALTELPRSTVDSALLQGSQAIFTLADLFDLSARGRLDTAFLSGVQIDRHGRINMSAIGPAECPKVRLPGGAGSALLLPTARRTILWRTRHDRRTFVDKLDFVTATGNAQWAVTPLCLFRRDQEGLLQVDSIHPGVTPAQLAEATGFAVRVSADTPVTPGPAPAELAALERLDPAGVRAAEF